MEAFTISQSGLFVLKRNLLMRTLCYVTPSVHKGTKGYVYLANSYFGICIPMYAGAFKLGSCKV